MIQTEHMNSAYQKHAGKVLCIDKTHGTTQYQFGLVAAVISDDKVLCINSTHGTTRYRFGLMAAVVSDDNGEVRKEGIVYAH